MKKKRIKKRIKIVKLEDLYENREDKIKKLNNYDDGYLAMLEEI